MIKAYRHHRLAAAAVLLARPYRPRGRSGDRACRNAVPDGDQVGADRGAGTGRRPALVVPPRRRCDRSRHAPVRRSRPPSAATESPCVRGSRPKSGVEGAARDRCVHDTLSLRAPRPIGDSCLAACQEAKRKEQSMNDVCRYKFLVIDDLDLLETHNLERKVNQAQKHPEPVVKLVRPVGCGQVRFVQLYQRSLRS